MRSLRLAALLLLALPASAQAGTASLLARDLPVGQSAVRVGRFDLVGLHWQGPGAVRFRTRSLVGRWSAWKTAAAESEDLPDASSPEARRARGWRLGNPYWTGPADAIQYRLLGRVRRLRAYFVRSAPTAAPVFARATADSPPIVRRSGWGAIESIRRAVPRYADAVRFAIVHHTAGSNSYSASQSAAIVRAIEVYHVRGNGWNDIGYNFLVDKYGQVFEGRYGGIGRPVIGAHAQGFNRGSVGVALIGNYSSASITPAARAALVRLLAWRLDVAHVDPLSKVRAVSTGNPRYAAGTGVWLRAISGHRDTGPTACPGNDLYAHLPGIARAVAATGLPKIYSPTVVGGIGGRVRFAARLSTALPWTVTVTDALNQPVASGSGTGTAVDWIWDATAVPRGRYAWAISAGPDARPATGSIGGPVAQLTVTDLRIDPQIVTPNGDGSGDTARVRYRLGAPATVTETVLDAAGTTVATLFSGFRSAGRHSFVWNDIGLPDGRYRLLLQAHSPGGSDISSATDFAVDRTLAGFAASSPAFSPNGDGRLDTLLLGFRLLAPADATLRITRGARRLTTLLSARLEAGPQQVVWDGTAGGKRLRDGRYTAVVTTTDPVATLSQQASVVIDTRPPRLRLVSIRLLRFWLSEPATVTADLDGERVVVERPRRGFFRIRHAPPRQLDAFAVDPAGNESARIHSP